MDAAFTRSTSASRAREASGAWAQWDAQSGPVSGCATCSDVLQRAGVKPRARDVMPIGLDEHEVRRPMPVEKAMRDDTLLVLKMNGETLPIDHGFPVRILVTGWTGTASIKWVGRIQVAEESLRSPYNTMEYTMIGPNYPMRSWPGSSRRLRRFRSLLRCCCWGRESRGC